MYETHFGFKHRPFQLLPNPDYLFLSRSHEEALAHLTYAVTHGDGFVAIIGEVGTGKTTICRSFLESLDPSIEAAYIFNPKMDSLELLKAVNDEFGIRSDATSVKELVDTLNVFLIEKKREGKKVIIIIDEAQNLTRDVLEQLRLTSNLETTTGKLLQIVLVGQPELNDLLQSHELRQLAQRISLSSHLVPLSEEETRDYIQYRLARAARRPVHLFTKTACRVIHQHARGIPRIINIACDRALIVGFGSNAQRITARVARQAIKELKGQGNPPKERQSYLAKRVALLVLLFLFLVLALVYYPEWRPMNSRTKGTADRKDADRPSEMEALGTMMPGPGELKPYPAEETARGSQRRRPASEVTKPASSVHSDPPEPEAAERTIRARAEKPIAIEEPTPDTADFTDRRRRESVERTFRTAEEVLSSNEEPVQKPSSGEESVRAEQRHPDPAQDTPLRGLKEAAPHAKGRELELPEPPEPVGSSGFKEFPDEPILSKDTNETEPAIEKPDATAGEPVPEPR